MALEVLTKRDGVFASTPAAARYLASGSKDDSRAALMHTAHLWARWSTLTECVRQGTSVTYTEMADRDDEWTRAFIAAMHKNATFRAPLVVRAVGPRGRAPGARRGRRLGRLRDRLRAGPATA